jgi:hypothetical protein
MRDATWRKIDIGFGITVGLPVAAVFAAAPFFYPYDVFVTGNRMNQIQTQAAFEVCVKETPDKRLECLQGRLPDYSISLEKGVYTATSNWWRPNIYCRDLSGLPIRNAGPTCT